MRRKLLHFWLTLACRTMLQAAQFTAELMAMRINDDLWLARRILHKATYGRPLAIPRTIQQPLVDEMFTHWEQTKNLHP